MKRSTRFFCAAVAALLLFVCLPLSALAEKVSVDTVVATSDLEQVAVLYGRADALEFSLTEGQPVRFNQSWQFCWEKYDETTQKWENFDGRFYPGTYRTWAQLRIDGEGAKTAQLADTLTCTVDGQAWTVESISNHGDYCTANATSPAIVIADDPAVTPPEDLEDVYFRLSGYVAGKKFSDTTFYPHLGSEDKIEIVDAPIYLDMTDGNGDGIPDCVDLQAGTFTEAEEITEGVAYAVIFSFRAKTGYYLDLLTGDGVHLSCRAPVPMNDMFSGYDGETGVFRSVLILMPCVTEVSFTDAPEGDLVGYHRGGYGELEIGWQTDGAVDKYQLYRWDQEDGWDVLAFTNVFGTSYSFTYDDGGVEGRFRIEAIRDGNTVAVSPEFTVTWQEETAVSLPIRIDASSAVGSKVPVDLTPFFPSSEQYDFADSAEIPVHQWIDSQTGEPAERFEQGKTYAYTVHVVSAPGYYFEVDQIFKKGQDPIVSDAVRAYGVGWDQVINACFSDGHEYYATFLFTYDEAVGIPAEADRLLAEAVFDGSALVGMQTPAPIPASLWNGSGLTLCDGQCDCGLVPPFGKEHSNRWYRVGAPEQPAASFEAGERYTYLLYFHVEDGWEVTGTPADFDFVLSGVEVETVELFYEPTMRLLAVELGFLCGESGAIEAGDHVCMRSLVEAVPPTCTERGTVAYYVCSCGKLYGDPWGIRALASVLEVDTVPALGHTYGETWLHGDGTHWRVCACGAIGHSAAHADANTDGSCDTCGASVPLPSAEGLGVGAIIGIAAGSVAVAAIGGFALLWFVIKKKSLADLLALFKKS